MKKSVLSVFFFLFTFLFTKSEPIEVLDTTQFHQKMKSLIENPLLINAEHPAFKSNFIWLDTIAYFNPPGTNHLFSIKNIEGNYTLNRLDEWIYHGTNFGSQFFYWNNNLYCFGGSGFYNEFFELMQFNLEDVEWNYQKVKNLPIVKSKFLWGWYFEDEFYCFYRQPKKENGNIVKFGKVDLNELQFYEIANLSDLNHELEEVMEVKSVIDESENYALFIYENQLKVLNKKKGVEGDFPHLSTIRLNYPFQPRLKGDTICYFMRKNTTLIKKDLNTVKLSDTKKIFNFYPFEPKEESRNYLWVFSGVLLIIPFLYWRQKGKKQAQTVYTDELLLKLEPFFGTEITRETLDKALGIDYKSVDSAKTIRSKYITQINQKNPNAIQRVTNPKDKRSYLYRIKIQ